MTSASPRAGQALTERPVMTKLPVAHLFDMSVELEPARLIPTALGTRMTFVAKRGRLEGPRIRGELLPGSADWMLAGGDVVGRADIRAMIQTDDGAMIYMTGLGVIKVPAEGLDRLAAGERLPLEETYVRITPRFETADERYQWLSEVVAVSHNQLSKDHIDYRVYQVL